MKRIMEDKHGSPIECKLNESVDGFGIPGSEKLAEDSQIAEGERHDYKGLLAGLMDAVEVHMAIQAGTAEEGAEDPLVMVMDATKEALAPKDDEGSKGSEDDAPVPMELEAPAVE